MIDSIPELILILLPIALLAIIAVVSAFTMEDTREEYPQVNQAS